MQLKIKIEIDQTLGIDRSKHKKMHFKERNKEVYRN